MMGACEPLARGHRVEVRFGLAVFLVRVECSSAWLRSRSRRPGESQHRAVTRCHRPAARVLSGGFDVQATLEAVAAARCAALHSVPTMGAAVLGQRGCGRCDLAW